MSGKVFQVTGKDNVSLAIKVMPLDSKDLLPDEIEDMRRECRLLKDVKHAHILTYVVRQAATRPPCSGWRRTCVCAAGALSCALLSACACLGVRAYVCVWCVCVC